MILSRGLLLLLVITVCLGSAAHAQTTAAAPNQPPVRYAPIDAEARDLLSRMTARYQRLGWLSETVERQAPASVYGFRRLTIVHSDVFGTVMTARDQTGTTTTARVFPQGHRWLLYVTRSDRPSEYVKQVNDNPDNALRLAFWFCGAVASGTDSLLHDDAIASLLLNPSLTSLSLGAPDHISDIPVQTAVFQLNNDSGNNSLTFFIGKDDPLLYRVVVTHTGAKAAPFTVTETHKNVQVGNFSDALKFPPSQFRWTPPKTSRQVANFTQKNTTSQHK